MSVESKLENIASIDNLYMSWSRLINSISYSDVWYDEYLLRKFEYNLDENIKLIHERLLNGTYELKDIRPIPFPKGGLDEAGKPKVRQAFLIDIADQLVWIAVCNILGPITEVRMPAWSTGNRLYVPMWKEDNKWHCGSFMSSSSNIYRRWGQSWPKYRKSLTASIKRLALGSYKKDSDTSEEKDILDDTDIIEIEDQQNGAMPDWMRICYLNDGYFKRTTYKDTLYWCSIDLAKYYPSIRLDYLKEMLYKYCSICEDKKVSDLISRLLDFKVNYEGYSDDELTAMNLKDKTFSALPTGLIVGGWLANVYLLDLDTSTDKKIKNNNGIIHFRYVDDHTFVSDDFDCLLDWVSEYVAELKNLKLVVNEDKIQPKIPEAPGFVFQNRILKGKEYIHSEPFKIRFQEKYGGDRVGSDLYTEFEKIKNFIRIDPQYPSPLMTLTLQKVSQISHLSLRLMSPNETDMVFHDLKSLISIDLPDAEIKKDTRISFASTMLSRLIVTDSIDLT